jgi:hypothetical protein
VCFGMEKGSASFPLLFCGDLAWCS